jgi:hypothetical protein
MQKNPFTLRVYDKNFNFQGFIGDPRTVVATPRFNVAGTLRVDLPGTHEQLANMSADGARVVCHYYDELLISGPVTSIVGTGPLATSVIAFYVDDDFRILDNTLGWPLPTAAVTSQTVENYKASGPAETVFKNLVTANCKTRLGMPVTVAASSGRGSSIDVSLRFDSIADKMFPVMDNAGVGCKVYQSGSGLIVDCYTPKTFPFVLSEDSGIVQNWAWTSSAPTATRTVVGGQGEGTARVFTLMVSTDGREAAVGYPVEKFTDARDADTATLLTSRGQAALDEGVSKSGFSLTLAETDNFRYGGDGVHVGDMVTVDIGAATRTDILREATLSFTSDKGLSITPTVGEIQDSPDRQVANFLKSLRKGIAQLRAGK